MVKSFSLEDWFPSLKKGLLLKKVVKNNNQIDEIMSMSAPTTVFDKYKTFQERVPEKFADDEKCEQLKAAMSDTYGRFGEAVFSCWIVDGIYRLNLSTEVLVQIGLFGCDNNLMERISRSVIRLQSMKLTDVTTTTIKPTSIENNVGKNTLTHRESAGKSKLEDSADSNNNNLKQQVTKPDELGHSIGHLPASAESNEPIIVKVNKLNRINIGNLKRLSLDFKGHCIE
uniref:SJCHGC02296 protein n=1 Tax=Schistosoma japonicum TaxID=6182 RepID=Q5DHH2_SCHJA|nr:SJCHGC02296 protein [Schistosoma japonicum]